MFGYKGVVIGYYLSVMGFFVGLVYICIVCFIKMWDKWCVCIYCVLGWIIVGLVVVVIVVLVVKNNDWGWLICFVINNDVVFWLEVLVVWVFVVVWLIKGYVE